MAVQLVSSDAHANLEPVPVDGGHFYETPNADF